MMFEMGQVIEHKTLGKGEVVYVDGDYIDVHFENDPDKYGVSTFSVESIQPFLVR